MNEDAWGAFCRVLSAQNKESLILGENREAVQRAFVEAVNVAVFQVNEKWQKLAAGLGRGWLDENGNFHSGS